MADLPSRTIGASIGRNPLIRVRIDSAGDCTKVMRTIDGKGAHFVIKAAPRPTCARRLLGGGMYLRLPNRLG